MADPYPNILTTKPTQATPKQNKKETAPYPNPLIIPAPAAHAQTLILLHGRGSNGEDFGYEFVRARTAGGQTLQEVFPGLKLIFPTAKKRRARWYNRATISQWFDNVPVDEQDGVVTREQAEWQLEGLRETAGVLGPLIDAEVRALGARNVFLGGLSQGCAMALHLLLSYQGDGNRSSGKTGREALGGFVGMSGWLPFAADMDEIILQENLDSVDSDDNPFGSDGGDDAGFGSGNPPPSIAARICDLMRENMNLPSIETGEPLCLKTPVLLGHGRNDEKVKMEFGLHAARILRDAGMETQWREYDEGHWYKIPEQIDDVVKFLRTRIEIHKS